MMSSAPLTPDLPEPVIVSVSGATFECIDATRMGTPVVFEAGDTMAASPEYRSGVIRYLQEEVMFRIHMHAAHSSDFNAAALAFARQELEEAGR